MEAIAFIPKPSPPADNTGGKISAPRSKDAFAPTLSKAVANRKNATTLNSKNPSSTSGHPEKNETATKHTIQDLSGSNANKTVNTEKDQTKALPVKTEGAGDKKGHDQVSNTEEITKDTPSQVTKDIDSKTIKFDEFVTGLLGYLLNLPDNLSSSDLQKESVNLSEKFGIGNKKSIDILSKFQALSKSASSKSEMLASLQQDPDLKATFEDTFQSLSLVQQSDKQNTGITPSSPAIQQQTMEKDSPPRIVIVGGEDTGKQATSEQSSEKLSQIADQLEKITAAHISEKPVSIHLQISSQNRSSGLDALSPPVFHFNENLATQNTDSSVTENALPVIGVKDAIGKPADDPRSSKLDELQNHHFAVKVEETNQEEIGKAQENDPGLQNADGHRQTNLLNAQSTTNAAGNTLQPGQFSFGNTLAQSLQTGQQATGMTPSPHLIPWTTVQENAIVNQVMQRFHMNINSPTSKMTVKLYPEELGELKIDIQMKDGSIKANICAQTQQVQQVLEKYIPKLRSFMEQQGLTVDDILVTNSSDNVGGHDLFQEDFVDNHDFSPPGKSAKQTRLSNIAFDTAFSEKTDVISGVNVIA